MIIGPEQCFHMRLPRSIVPEVWILSRRSERSKHLPNLLVQEEIGVLPWIGVLPLKLLGPRHRRKALVVTWTTCAFRFSHLDCCFIDAVPSSGQPLRIIKVRVVRRVAPFLP